MSKIEVNTITQQCGPSLTVGGGACKSVTLDATTVTLGRCGATVSLAAGATQTGFGRTGTVDWCTTAKTAPFTGVSGKGYFVNTTCGAVTVTLPATPSAGDIISIKDYARTAGTNNINFCRNGSKMDGVCSNSGINTNGESTTLIYVDGTKGWTSILDSTTSEYGAIYINATGGTVTTCGDYKIHTFTSDGCFSVSEVGNPAGSTTVDYLVVAGGGGNGVGSGGGAGGAGGARMSSGTASGSYTASPLGSCVAALPVTATTYPITVGGGGTGSPSPSTPSATGTGSNSVFSTITSAGGGGGGSESGSSSIKDGASGGSGGGGNYNPGNVGGTGNTPPVSPPQGNNGGTGATSPGYSGGGGGGAACAGQNGTSPGVAGPGGNGISNSITGSATYYAGGGGGGSQSDSPSAVPAGTGGLGGGGNGSARGGTIGTAGTANTGGGAGGGWSAPGSPTYAPLNGGSGIVIIRYKFQ
jgi:hypothetical protein